MVWIPTEEEALNLLSKHRVPAPVVEHSKAVTAFLKKIASGLTTKRNLLLVAGLLHDIGKCQTNSAKHGFLGARLLRNEGVDEDIVRMVERHVGVGITKDEAQQIGLPARDFIPETTEEKLLCYADKLVLGTYVATPQQARIDFESNLTPNHPAIKRWDAFMKQMQSLTSTSLRPEFDPRLKPKGP